MWLTIFLCAILFISLAMQVREGLWSNAITLLNVITAALIATSFWEPAADWLEQSQKSLRERTYWVDFLAIWGIFCVAMILLRSATDQLSKTAVRFKKPVDVAGGMLCACWTGWVLLGFTLTTLHMAPLARHSFGNVFQPTPEARMFPFAPDHQWLAFVQSVSRGAFCTSAPEREGEEGLNAFDPRGEFILRYAQRRKQFEENAEGGRVPAW